MVDTSATVMSLILKLSTELAGALASFKAHEVTCSERNGDMIVSTARIHGRIDQLFTTMETSRKEDQARHDAWVKEDQIRKERRDRDTRVTTRSAVFAAVAAILSPIVAAILLHLMK